MISLSGKNLDVSGLKKSYVYKGKVIKPAVTVKYNRVTLIKGQRLSSIFYMRRAIASQKL